VNRLLTREMAARPKRESNSKEKRQKDRNMGKRWGWELTNETVIEGNTLSNSDKTEDGGETYSLEKRPLRWHPQNRRGVRFPSSFGQKKKKKKAKVWDRKMASGGGGEGLRWAFGEKKKGNLLWSRRNSELCEKEKGGGSGEKVGQLVPRIGGFEGCTRKKRAGGCRRRRYKKG